MTSEECTAYIKDLVDFSDSSEPTGKSEVVEFFAHTNILVTGGTGFLGKLLIEKLLRSCPDISKIYMIVRPKKGKNPDERYKENFDNIIYDRLKREQPHSLSKVVMLEGDAAKEDYGLTPEDKELLKDTNIIFHAAAIVRFEEKIRTASNINVKSTKFLLTFAKTLPKLKVFVHVSTAFSNCVHDVIEEKHYKDTIDADKFLTLVDILDDEMLNQITPILLDKWPNTYVLTKALGENIVLKYSDDLPVCIVRPSIVVSTFKEPIAAWTNNMYGATGVVMGSGIGIMRTLHCIPENVADIMPADYVVCNIICSAWDTYNRKAEKTSDEYHNLPDDERVPIYNSVSSCQNPISWREFMHQNEMYGFDVPSTKAVWYYMFVLNRYFLVHIIYAFFLHTIPAVVVDTLTYLRGRKPMCLETYRKINKFSSVISYFTIRQWKFRNDNVIKLWEKMNSTDRENFCFNIAVLDWTKYFYNHVRGLRVYMLNDSLDSLEEGRKRYKKLYIAHCSIVAITTILILWLAFTFLRFIWSRLSFIHE